MKRFLAAAITIGILLGTCPVGSKKVSAAAAAPEVEKVSMKFDLGGKGTASGYIGVSASDQYTASKGYGIGQTHLAKDVDAGGTGALSDAIQFEGQFGEFCVDLPSGVYKITVTTGNNQSVNISAEGVNQLYFLTGNNATDSFIMPVTDGQLNIYASRGVGDARSLCTVEIEETEAKPTIWIAGDSTAAKTYNAPADGRKGWGEYLPNYVDTNTYEIRNISASGMTAPDLKENLFPTIETYGKEGDILLLSLGINDYSQEYEKHKDDPSRIDPSTYVTNITAMVKSAKKKGMKVYLVKQHGTDADTGRYPLPTHAWFGKQLDQIASSEGVETIDIFRPWLEMLLENLFYTRIDYYYQGVEINALGADKQAEIVYKQLFNITEPGPLKSDPYPDFEDNATVLYEAEESGEPVKNPHKGYCITVYTADMIDGTYDKGYGGSANNQAWNVATVISGSPHWDDLNPEEGVYDWSSIDAILDACEKAGLTYGIRIMPYSSYLGKDFVPKWVYEKGAKTQIVDRKDKPGEKIEFPVWDDPTYLDACKKFAKALGEKYDGDPRVEFVDVRPFGDYGEWHTAFTEGNYMPSIEIQKDMLDCYKAAFKTTTLALPSDGWGEIYQYALSIGITKRDDGLVATPNIEWSMVPTYKANMPVYGEYLWPVSMMQDYVRDNDFAYINWSPERFKETIEISHLSIMALDQDSECGYAFYNAQQPVVDEMCNRLGYNFTVTSASRNGNQLKVVIENTGVAPAFFDISLRAEITDAEGNKLGNFGDAVLIKKGAFHDGDKRAYMFTYKGELPEDAIICLSMYDINNSVAMKKADPTVRFDNKNNLPTNRLQLVSTWKEPVATYSVTVNSGVAENTSGTGSGSAMSIISAPAGSTIAITADEAAEGKEFDKWVVNGGSVRLSDAASETATFKMPAEPVEITATYKDIVYKVKVNGGTADKTSAIAGTKVTITAGEPESGKEFDKWVVKSGSITLSSVSTKTATFEMIAGNVEITATYKDIPVTKYSVTVNSGVASVEAASGASGAAVETPAAVLGETYSIQAEVGAKVTLTAAEPSEGKMFDKWVINSGSVSLADASSSTTTFKMPAGNVEITATYKNIPAPTYTVTVYNGTAVAGASGSGAGAAGATGAAKITCEAGEKVTLTAGAPAEDKEFDKWVVETGSAVLAEETASITTFEMPAGDVTITATYKDKYVPPTVYAITVNGGSSDKETAAEGETVAITAAAPVEGKEFDKWIVGSGSAAITLKDASSSVTSFVMPAGDVSVTATYKDTYVPPTEYNVTVNSGMASKDAGAGSGSGSGAGAAGSGETGSGAVGESSITAVAGETITITAAEPAEGKMFDKWVVNSGAVTLSSETSATATFTMPAADVEVTATYKTIPPTNYIVTVNSGSADKEMAPEGETVIITAAELSPEEGKVFDKWVVVSGSVILSDEDASETIFVMPAENVEIKATYKEKEVKQEPKPVHKIYFDLGGGTLAGRTGVIEIEAEEGSTIIVPAAPTKEGYNFRYWKGSIYYPGDEYVVSGEHTLTAVWELDISNETTTRPLVRPDTGSGAGSVSGSANGGTQVAPGTGNSVSGTNSIKTPSTLPGTVTNGDTLSGTTADPTGVSGVVDGASGSDGLPTVDQVPTTGNATGVNGAASGDPVPKTGDTSSDIEFPRWVIVVGLAFIVVLCGMKMKKNKEERY